MFTNPSFSSLVHVLTPRSMLDIMTSHNFREDIEVDAAFHAASADWVNIELGLQC
ncbi:hypothetical protein V8D89_008188 [Ganoderma adspersum]